VRNQNSGRLQKRYFFAVLTALSLVTVGLESTLALLFLLILSGYATWLFWDRNEQAQRWAFAGLTALSFITLGYQHTVTILFLLLILGSTVVIFVALCGAAYVFVFEPLWSFLVKPNDTIL
jgi:uncharacterized membrane protein